MTKEDAKEFTVDNLEAIRNSLEPEHKQILDLTWEHEIKNNDGLAIRNLAKIFGKKSADEVLGGIDAFIRRDYNSRASKAIRLNVLGSLLTNNGSALVALQIQLLDIVRQKFDLETDIDQIQCASLPNFDHLSDHDLVSLLRMIQVNGLNEMPYSFSGFSNNRA